MENQCDAQTTDQPQHTSSESAPSNSDREFNPESVESKNTDSREDVNLTPLIAPPAGSMHEGTGQDSRTESTESGSTSSHEADDSTPSKAGQNRDSDESQGIEPSESKTPKIPRGLAGDRVRLKIAAQYVRNEFFGIKEGIDALLGWDNKNDKEKTD